MRLIHRFKYVGGVTILLFLFFLFDAIKYYRLSVLIARLQIAIVMIIFT